MKTILFFRHGKSDWNAAYDGDMDRPLQKRGRKAARLMGAFLSVAGELPEIVLTSPAVRARTTVELAVEAGGWPVPVRMSDVLYEGGPDRVLQEIAAQPDEVGRLMLVGHEPTFSQVLGRLIGGAGITFPTGAVARVDLDVYRWQETRDGAGSLRWLVTPKLLRERE
ncbi:MAG TPA: histidine phosphatase family protein [Rhodothermales bacterium]|nr:histidine phosphatase family protein [Rhodothermales bacterium]